MPHTGFGRKRVEDAGRAREVGADLLRAVGLDDVEPPAVRGAGPVLPSVFPVSTAAAACVGAVMAAGGDLWRARGGAPAWKRWPARPRCAGRSALAAGAHAAQDRAMTQTTASPAGMGTGEAGAAAPAAGPTTEQVWRAVARASFAVLSYVTPDGAPRSSGIVYATAGRRLFVVVAPDGWKARQITTGARVSVTVPVRRGGLLSLLLPIPPATISFHGRATIHPPGTLRAGALPPQLVRLLPAQRHDAATVIEVEPEGEFLTYGVGVQLMRLQDPAAARGRAPV
jgi:hypothetical protein